MLNLPRSTLIVPALIVGVLAQLEAAETGAIRVATYNTSLYRDAAGQLIRDLERGDNEQARNIAEVIQRVRPDVLFLNEFDYDAPGRAAELFRTKYLAVGQNGGEPINFADYFIAPVNTGVPSGRDLDHNGRTGDAADAIGYGKHPGQYGMLVLSRFPINHKQARTFQNYLWRDMPGARLPRDPRSGKPFYNDDDLSVQRLSSKSFWDVPIEAPAIPEHLPFTLHLLGAHPTPPVFDGPEDRNGCRNHDEIRLIADYIEPSKCGYLKDDAGKSGGLAADSLFVIVGDLNCDPIDGDGIRGAMELLLKSPRVNALFTPASEGGLFTVSQFPDQFQNNRGNPAHVTANFTAEGHGCLRIDYVLASRGFDVNRGGVFWPKPGEPGAASVTATDHRLVWLDLQRN